ncbi:putative methyltransferase At1g22800, mitochondrial isoform X2 [Argentina anserina]|uniref:putative methyltransferase At1g22800, mitochondrial isoform X2 n=1 Tax=Argentina anserina TaxID=57926 RepID=UPI002176373C|nr:putative methyltransferase At1g22800, mitochondrial isoform X2 [Potentilla anserina]
MEREGGISPRISPLAQVRDAGNLLTMAGFTLPGVDLDEYVVRYPSGYLYDWLERALISAEGQKEGICHRIFSGYLETVWK